MSKHSVALANAIIGAALLVSTSATAAPADQSMEKCYGVSKAGENACAHAKGIHSCAGLGKVNYDGSDWKMVKTGTCESLKGSTTPLEGVNKKASG